MKKLQFLILILASVLLLQSCDGIGDGALTPGNVGAVLDNKEEITNAEAITEPTVTESIENDSAETEPAVTKSDLNTERSSSAPERTKKRMKSGEVHLSTLSISSSEDSQKLQNMVPSIIQVRRGEKPT